MIDEAREVEVVEGEVEEDVREEVAEVWEEGLGLFGVAVDVAFAVVPVGVAAVFGMESVFLHLVAEDREGQGWLLRGLGIYVPFVDARHVGFWRDDGKSFRWLLAIGVAGLDSLWCRVPSIHTVGSDDCWVGSRLSAVGPSEIR